MDRRQAKRWIKEQMEDYLTTHKGLNVRKPFHCLNPEHPDKNPSMSFDRRRNKVHCFACGKDYDIFDLISLDYGLTETADIFQQAYQIFNITPDEGAPKTRAAKFRVTIPRTASAYTPTATDITPAPAASEDYSAYIKICQSRLDQTDYPARRGLSPETAEFFGLGYDPKFPAGGGQFWQALIIPTGPGSFTARNTDPKADKTGRVRKKGASPVFNAETMWAAGPPVLIVEGEIDAMAVHEAGGRAVGLGSTANVGAFLRLVEARPPLVPLLLALDNDEEGRRAGEKLKEGLAGLQIDFYEVALYGDAKDAGEALLGDPEALSGAVREAEAIEAAALAAEREAYLATSVAHHLEAFKNGVAAGIDTPHLPTGFKTLDAHLDGGLFEGLYIMGGITSLGKTSLALQMADQMAEAGHDVLIFSLEMARSELMAKSLSRLTLQLALDYFQDSKNAKTARGLTCGSRYAHYGEAELRLIGEALDLYGGYAGRLFISEGVGDIGAAEIRREVEKHLRHTGKKPVVLVDYLQILSPWSDRATDKQNTDKAVLELKRLSRDFKIPVIGLSSFNRANYREAVTMEAFKESGAIEYSSDVLLGLQLKGAGEKDFDAAEAREKNPRQVELVILKNRHGPAGKRVGLEYYPLFNYFQER